MGTFSANDTSWIWRDAATVASIFDGSVMHRELTKASSVASSIFDSDMVKGLSRSVLEASSFSSIALDLERRSRVFDFQTSQVASMAGLTPFWKDLSQFAELKPAWTTSPFDTAASASMMAQTKLFSAGMFDGTSDSVWKQMLGESTRLQGFAAANQWRRPETFAAAILLGETGTEVDALGGLWAHLSSEGPVLRALDNVVGTVATRGPLGIDYEAINDGAERLAFELSDLEREERRIITEAADQAADATHTGAPGIRERLALFGLDRFARDHRTEAGIILGFTVGLTYAVMQLGAGVHEPATFWEAAAWGGGTYTAVRAKLRP